MGKCEELFHRVCLGIETCATEGDCALCPYRKYPRLGSGPRKIEQPLQCEQHLIEDKDKLSKLMAFLDKINEEVE